MSIKIFAIFVSSLFALFAIIASLTGVGVKSMVDTSKETLEEVRSVSERTAVIETQQTVLMRRLDPGGESHEFINRPSSP